MSTGLKSDEHRLLDKLALALIEAPRANLQELARHVGVSKATLYRFCRTRNELLTRIARRCIEFVDEIADVVDHEQVDPLETLQRIATLTQEHRELMSFMGSVWSYDEKMAIANANWFAKADAFFLRGQQAGVFRIDVPAAVLTELWGSMSQSLIDAERRGRAARAGLPDLIRSVFLDGARAHKIN